MENQGEFSGIANSGGTKRVLFLENKGVFITANADRIQCIFLFGIYVCCPFKYGPLIIRIILKRGLACFTGCHLKTVIWNHPITAVNQNSYSKRSLKNYPDGARVYLSIAKMMIYRNQKDQSSETICGTTIS